MIKEEVLIEKCQEGRTEHFADLYEFYVKKIYNFIYFKTFHIETAEDLTSKTFLKALENIGKFKSDKAQFSTWLYQIAKNNVIDHYRTHKETTDIEDVWDLSSDADEQIKKDTDTRIMFEKVKKHMSCLSGSQRDVIMLRLWQDLSYREIAEITGKTESSCRIDFSRAIKKIKKDVILTIFIIIFSIL
jgi:RNA polymerase sigma-70 factor (ECF subfamily)